MRDEHGGDRGFCKNVGSHFLTEKLIPIGSINFAVSTSSIFYKVDVIGLMGFWKSAMRQIDIGPALPRFVF